METFTQKVLDVVRYIPKGETRSYKEVAIAAGSPGAARAVGTILAANQDLSVPCHRIIRSDGSYGPYNGLRGKTKAEILIDEGYSC